MNLRNAMNELLKSNDVNLDATSTKARFNLRSLFWITLFICASLAFIVNLPSILYRTYRAWEVGEQFDEHIFEGPRFSFKVTAFHQRGAVMAAPGGFYRCEVKTDSDWWWRKIVVYRYAVPEPIPDNRLRRVTDTCAYFFHGDTFGVTTDGGRNWSVKSPPEFPPILSGQSLQIESVSIEPHGTGVMVVMLFDDLKREWTSGHTLETSDFGQNWAEQ